MKSSSTETTELSSHGFKVGIPIFRHKQKGLRLFPQPLLFICSYVALALPIAAKPGLTGENGKRAEKQ